MKDPTREAAFSLLVAVLEHFVTLDAALDRITGIDARDKAAAHRLAAAVLRHAETLDAVLEPFLRREPPGAVRHVLRMGAAAMLFLAAPAHAAVGTAVDLARTKKLAPFAGLINAVLRKVASSGPGLLGELDMPRLDTPPWAWASWGAEARVIATAHQVEAPLDVTVTAGARLAGEVLPTGSVRFPAGTAVMELPGFTRANFGCRTRRRPCPLWCWRPGRGKGCSIYARHPAARRRSWQLRGARVTAVERDASRLATLKGNLQRLRLEAELVQADATIWRPDQKFSAILLDAPCSATGTIRRHPDLLHLRSQRDVLACTALQDRLLDAAVDMLAPGGRLIYAVCSLQPEEGALRVAAACARLGVKRVPILLPQLRRR